MWSAHDLIVAPATVPGGGARAIVRIAGDGLDRLLATLFTPERSGFAASGTRPRVVSARLAAAGLGREWGAIEVAILHWPGPAGPTGGPLAEVQLPASPPLVEAVVAEACRRGARLARGGEFTLRGFLAGRLDLVQAEAVLAVVDAQSPAELAVALDRMAGGAGKALGRVRDDLLDLLADIEATIDFADETAPDTVPTPLAHGPVGERLRVARAALAAELARLGTRAAAAHDLPRVVFMGRPNIGKSSLFNVLVGRDAALVADEQGTTRDWIECRLEPPGGAGPACVLVDVAGVDGACGGDGLDAAAHSATGVAMGPAASAHQPASPAAIDAAAADVARREIARADLVVVCRDAGEPAAAALPAGSVADARRIDVVTRCDRDADAAVRVGEYATSAVSGRGTGALREAILAAVAALPPRGSPATLRLAAGLEAAAAALAAAAAILEHGQADEPLLAAHVRQALDALDEVTGRSMGADLLDRIFARHCIGK
ncbi:tRNA modification GTPase MnmE [Planctomycetia bacterium]|nr:tRNA modification GTPase MnmE [Planctomycetia bacterium]